LASGSKRHEPAQSPTDTLKLCRTEPTIALLFLHDSDAFNGQ
jgi:hypothetical protein